MPSSQPRTLDKKIADLAPEVDRTFREELYRLRHTLREGGDPISVLMNMSRVSLLLLRGVFDRAGYEELPSNNLYACILRAANGDTKEKIQGLRLLPDELASYLHTLRTFSNKPDHAVEQIKLSRAVDKMGQTIDCLLTEERDEQAAKRFLTKAIRRHGVPEKVTIDGSAANEAAIKSYNEEHGTAIAIRKIKWRKDVVCRVHRSPPRGHRGRASHPWPGPWQVAKHPIGVAPCLI